MSAVFPIMTGYRYEIGERISAIRKGGGHALIVSLPWAMLAPHEAQALSNHSQSLKRLAERGGLSAGEAVAILEGRNWSRTIDCDEAVNNAKLAAKLAEFLASTPDAPGAAEKRP